MRRPDLAHLRSKCRTRPAWLLAIMAVAVLGLATVGSAAPSGSSDLKITKTDSPDPVNVGSTLTYTIRVQNLGPDAATGVTSPISFRRRSTSSPPLRPGLSGLPSATTTSAPVSRPIGSSAEQARPASSAAAARTC
jgi:Domain of unknown function DUF11